MISTLLSLRGSTNILRQCGTKSEGKGRKRQQKIAKQVREAKMKKREARKEFNEAKKIGASLGLQASTGKKINLGLTIGGASIPVAEQPVKFRGMRVEIPHDQSKSKTIIITELERMLQRIDSCPLTRKQKLLLYRFGVCPRLSWLLTIEELPISWVEKNADALATDFLQQWSRLATRSANVASANVAPLYLSQKLGGLILPLISSLYKKLQVSRQGQLVTSQDPCVHLMAEKRMMREATLSRHKFRAGDVIREVMQASPNPETSNEGGEGSRAGGGSGGDEAESAGIA